MNKLDRYPLQKWKQDEDDWDEERYKAEDVDQMTGMRRGTKQRM